MNPILFSGIKVDLQVGIQKRQQCYIAYNVQFEYGHNIIQTHSTVLWDRQYFTKYSSHSTCSWGIFYWILSVPQNTIMGLNNFMDFIAFLRLETKKGNNAILFIIFNLNINFITLLRLATLYMFDKVFASFSFLTRKTSKIYKKARWLTRTI
jgi:hypothetical protein